MTEGPAKVLWSPIEKSFTVALEIDHFPSVIQVRKFQGEDLAIDLARDINRALSTLVRRAELAERMAEALKDLFHHGCPVPGPADPETGEPIPVPHQANVAEAEEVLRSWDAIKGDGE